VLEALERVEVPYLVVGSTAAAAWGVARMTRDVDIVALIGVDDVQALVEALAGDDLYLDAGEAADAAAGGRSFNVIHPASGGKVDVFVSSSTDDFTRSRLARRTRATVLGVPTWVATAEDVVLAKLRWRLETRSETQWRDCVEIAGSQDLDRGYLWHWAPSLGVEEDLGELLALIDQVQ
jgi:hypothetical protein